MLYNKLKNKHIILASGSPRRQKFLKDLGLKFEIRLKEVEEHYPDDLNKTEITDFLAKIKAKPFTKKLKKDEILITSDTIVWLKDKAIGKPGSPDEAKKMLRELSGNMHEVITSVALTDKVHQVIINDITKVYFKALSNDEIDYYLENYKPYDKAGSYGIQEWIGFIGIEKIEGSYFNVMGFPIHKFYQALLEF
ncbi:MAG: septum formation protein Maf [Flavobacteriia bacterium]|nr:MAG: septum formation protein Maf [Flavobacteriia bacterium]